MECVFCNIIKGKVPADLIYQDSDIVAFNDINPKAPVHVLIIPRKHIASVNGVQEEDAPLLGKLFIVGRKIANDLGIAQGGFRLVVNTGPDAGQIVEHLHVHLLGGERVKGMF
ncbi:MAG: histidine triad nucleotide-binding protein [Candidatus Jacksonbacteria bacterium RIFOXYC2_FULL_44_29]|nr:MAG: hypothetical protein UW45_C0016G0006 [Parcubacteria group bacterium GW2011_GWC2_44_22]OGY75482.1 MAG: histidine triad nucleotide-binding protein [Candidatus Jacksonbacteria bacterium RIFOXYA2_FULL_43_12]OGY76978.1 MAG: histidine triad nucleotide-binding protein [Candidatus Jacksonbacteria bacterium RIFOXYB2_FULL_44_15]OGY77830.1 MAG: histidine triad nucleotide-binding protein [Candidatus Jacksonbacteria bacterium RIFOXYC2_FULL_44_29]OGY80247.1 MAG: histidine triad nucleotide-binding pro